MQRKFILILLSLFFMGCLNSPLLHHEDANAQTTPDILATEQKECPIEFNKFQLCASMTWLVPASNTQEGELMIKFWDKNNGSINGPYATITKTVFVDLWMPSMNHRSAPVTTEQMKDDSGQLISGFYKSSNVFFIMPGQWQILIQLKQNEEILEQAIVDVEI